jgi:Carboxypeptidase regulatory-like domain
MSDSPSSRSFRLLRGHVVRTFTAAVAALVLAAPGAAAQEAGALVLKVTDAGSGVPLAGARVSVDGRPRGETDAEGRVRVEALAPGWHALKVAMLGWRPAAPEVMVPARAELALAVALEPQPVPIGVVKADGAGPPGLAGFYDRLRRDARGRTLSGGDLRPRGVDRPSDILRRFPEVEVIEGPHGRMVRFRRTFAAIRDGVGFRPPDCAPAYYVDGVPFRLDSPDLFHLRDLEGIELYPGNVPPEYGGSRASCGVVALWTRGVSMKFPRAPAPRDAPS